MISEPKVQDRDAQHYVGIRTLASIPELPEAIPGNHGNVYAWLKEHGLSPNGPPFIRYHRINMETKLDIELGVPVASAVTANEGVSAGVLPAGRYASLVYTGPYAGDGLMRANAALLDWGARQGLLWDRSDNPDGDAFGSRYESYITDPGDEPDPMKWVTEVAIRIADDSH
jgi:effector-binding domain-containing protein